MDQKLIVAQRKIDIIYIYFIEDQLDNEIVFSRNLTKSQIFLSEDLRPEGSIWMRINHGLSLYIGEKEVQRIKVFIF